MKQNVILGAGPAGLSCAYELSRHGLNSVTIEKNSCVGGLARTLNWGSNFASDIGPHRFYSKKKEIYKIIERLLGKKWVLVNRHTSFFIRGRYYNYPVNLSNVFKTAGPLKVGRMFFDYLAEKSKWKFKKSEPENFEEYALKNFGRSLAEFNILNYTEKVWGLPCHKLSADWGTQRIKNLSIKEIIKNLIVKSKNKPKTIVDHFYYPETGTGLIYERMAEEIKKKKSSIIANAAVKEIRHSRKGIQQIKINVKGKEKSIECKNLISSIPIIELIECLKPIAPEEIFTAAKKLNYRSQVYLFLKLNKEKISGNQWIYFPELNIPFGRSYEPKNFSLKMCPKGKSSIVVEYFVTKNDKVWKKEGKELFEETVGELEGMGLLKRGDVVGWNSHREEKVYPVYDLKYKRNLQLIIDYFNEFGNLHCIGRHGTFKYDNQDIAIQSGLNTAENIIKGKRSLWSIEEEREYLEKGKLRESE